jgi:hypothetical protein
MEIRHPSIPDGLLRSLEAWRGKYTDAKFFYQSAWIDLNTFIGVFGDGPNGSYEWFIWEAGQLRTSDKGFGSDSAALRDAFIESGAGLTRAGDMGEPRPGPAISDVAICVAFILYGAALAVVAWRCR